MKIQVKDRVASKRTNEKGLVVMLLEDGSCQVLWDRDWRSGKTRLHRQADLIKLKAST